MSLTEPVREGKSEEEWLGSGEEARARKSGVLEL